MLAGSLSIEKLDSDYWLDAVEKMEKEGIDFVNVSKVDIHMKKKLGVFGGAGYYAHPYVTCDWGD